MAYWNHSRERHFQTSQEAGNKSELRHSCTYNAVTLEINSFPLPLFFFKSVEKSTVESFKLNYVSGHSRPVRSFKCLCFSIGAH